MRRIVPAAWCLAAVSGVLQVLIFPLASLEWLSWIALAPLFISILRARESGTLQLEGEERRLPATPGQGFALGYLSGIIWVGGSFYWIFGTMHLYGGLSSPAAAFVLVLFSLYIGLYPALFGLVLAVASGLRSKSARPADAIRRALIAAPFLWVAVEFARARTSPVPWELLGYAQTSNLALTRIASFAGVYALSFEIALVNSVFAAAFLAPKERRKILFAAALAAAALLQSGEWLRLPPVPSDRRAVLVQPDIPVQDGGAWTKDYFQTTLRDLTAVSLSPTGGAPGEHYDFTVWPESPSPFYTNDPMFEQAVGQLAAQSRSWVIAGAIGVEPPSNSNGASQIFNSAALISPQGEQMARYDKVHLVPFGEYLPFPQLFAFAGGLTREVGEFQRGSSRAPLAAGNQRLGTFICYESIFPEEVRQFTLGGAQVLLNISNDGWYGDSGAWKEHLHETRMRAIENGRWLLLATNTGISGSIDPYGRVVVSTPRSVRTALVAPYALITGTTFYTRHGDWFAWLCAIISIAALLAQFVKKSSR